MNKADIHICFHGHTHVPHYEIYKNKIFIFDSRTQKKIPQSLIDKDQDILNEFKRFACQK